MEHALTVFYFECVLCLNVFLCMRVCTDDVCVCVCVCVCTYECIIYHCLLCFSAVVCTGSYGLSDNQKELQRTAYEFSQNEFLPQMRRWDEEVGPGMS